MEAPSTITDRLVLPPAPRPARRLTLSSGEVSYLALGGKEAAQTVVFLHGFGGNFLSWQYNITAIAGSPRVIAIDLPGHGGSDLPHAITSIEAVAEWLGEVLDALGVARCHIVGHSLGGWAGLVLAQQQPDRVGALSLLASAGFSRRLNVPKLRKLLDDGDREAFANAVEWLASGSSNVLPNFDSTLLRQLEIVGMRRCLSEMLERVIAPAFDTRLTPFDWSDIRMPVQIIWGENDNVLAPPAPETCSVGKLSLVPDAGHMVHLQQPAVVNRLLKEFAAGLT